MVKKVKYGYRPVAADVSGIEGGEGGYTYLHFSSLNVPMKRDLSFPAIVTDFTDSYQSNWNNEEVYGRMDPIAIFKNTQRSLSLGFKIVPESIEAAHLLQSKLNTLIQLLYPSYTKAGVDGAVKILKGAPLFRIKFGNLITNSGTGVGTAKQTGLPGYIKNLSVTPDLEEGFMTDKKNLLPKTWSINFDFQVLHDQTPGWHNGKFMNKKNKLDYPYGGTGKATVKKAASVAADKKNKLAQQERRTKQLQILEVSKNIA